MFERERTLYAYLLGYIQNLTADLTDEQLQLQPAGALNPPVWILGHMAIATDYGLKTLGHDMACPKKWHVIFGPGSKPLPETNLPTKAELLNELAAGHQRFSAAASAASVDQLGGQQPIDFLQPAIATVGELVAHLLTTHEAIHVGQLSAWRRAAGLPSVNLV